jgi:hypothetical protein
MYLNRKVTSANVGIERMTVNAATIPQGAVYTARARAATIIGKV